MSKTTPIAIIGTGFAGLGMAIKLKEAGFEDFVILEQGNDVGGTWRDNHYPGCACDVQSALYSFSFEQNPNWSRMYAQQSEILDYLRHCAEKYDLKRHIRFNTHVAGAHFDEKRNQWTVETASSPEMWAYMQKHDLKPGEALDRDDPELPAFNTLTARVLISGMGGLSTPAYPNLPGLDAFEGKRFHSQDWDHQYDLKGKRVAVIGTGASAIQFVPELAKDVARLDLYQRTPPWIMPKPDREMKSWEKAVFRRVPAAQSALRNKIYWQLESRVLALALNPRLMKIAELEARRHIRSQIPDKALRKAVTPDYTIGCKRILLSNNYYPALAQSNVDVLTDGIGEIRAHSIVDSNGVEREVDAIIFGTGFKAQEPVPARMIFGRNGEDLLDAWKEGAEAYKGTTVNGFPNFFMLVGPNTGLGHSSMVYMIESQIQYVMSALTRMKQEGWEAVEVAEKAQSKYNAMLQSKSGDSVWQSGCNSWYINENGKNTTLWPSFTWAFRQQTSQFDAEHYHCETSATLKAVAGEALPA
ncbi:flavin-containing monooxygenase [Marinobacter sp. V034]|uniref:flavin-containing monooxygenase n=1 Tax=Marinobacter sp. V034 TaxID=3459610 RepID=UPI004044EB79